MGSQAVHRSVSTGSGRAELGSQSTGSVAIGAELGSQAVHKEGVVELSQLGSLRCCICSDRYSLQECLYEVLPLQVLWLLFSCCKFCNKYFFTGMYQ